MPQHRLDPDQVVALGAAVQAALIADDHAVRGIVMTDVCPFTLGVEISKDFGIRRMDGYFLPVIHRNTTIPVSREETVYTVHEGQNEVLVNIYQGEGRKVADNLKIGELRVTGIQGTKRTRR
ncbi:MAG: Hsp70 family protein [Planctomycetota bacterium]